jgi:hypothetical protein
VSTVATSSRSSSSKPTADAEPTSTEAAEKEAAKLAEPLQKAFDEAEERGLIGVEVDPTDNSAYTFGGAAAGEATPETDPDHARSVRQQVDDAARQR